MLYVPHKISMDIIIVKIFFELSFVNFFEDWDSGFTCRNFHQNLQKQPLEVFCKKKSS